MIKSISDIDKIRKEKQADLMIRVTLTLSLRRQAVRCT